MISYYKPGYSPKKNELVCDYSIVPHKTSLLSAADSIAGESSIGTWTDISTMKPRISAMAPKIFYARGKKVRIAHPEALFEKSNMAQIMSGIAGNIFGMEQIEKLRLDDVLFPDSIINSFKGPRFGIQGIRKLLGVKKRPLVGTIIKPKIGLHPAEHARVAYDAWIGGCDVVKDDENLTSQGFNRFKERMRQTLRFRDLAEKKTGEKKIYMPNVTAETFEMIKRAKIARDFGSEYAMVDIITCGWSALQTLREQELGLVIHAHRAGHAALDRTDHGIAMLVIARAARLIGVDQLHVGTAGVGKMHGSPREEQRIISALVGPCGKHKPVFPVASGGLHPGMIPLLLDRMGTDVICQFGGGIHGHPLGTVAGAMAVRQAVDAYMEGIPIREQARQFAELRMALEHWPEHQASL